MATLAPMPSARESRATPVTIGVRRICLKANVRSRASDDSNAMEPLTARFTGRLGSRLLLAAFEREAGPGLVDCTHFEIHPAGAKARLSNDVAVEVGNHAGRFLWPREPERLRLCHAAHGKQVGLQLGGSLGESDEKIRVVFGAGGETYFGGHRLQGTAEPSRRSEQRHLEPGFDAKLLDRRRRVNDLGQFFRVALTFIVGMEPRAREMMQPVFVCSTCCWNVAWSILGTTASTVSSIKLMRKPLSSLFRCTSALVLTLVGVKPACASELDSAIEKHPACAAPSSSSGLAPAPFSKRVAKE